MTSASQHPLPPGQRRLDGFPRFGTHFHQPPPDVPADPVIAIDGAVTKPDTVRLTDLATLPRREITADFHCVAGWSATDLHWAGVGFSTFYDAKVQPLLAPGTTVTHLVFVGLDGYRIAVRLEDALGDDVLLADHLDGHRLDGNHGAPIRLVSPRQYGYVNVKHLGRIEVHTSDPSVRFHPSWLVDLGLRVVMPHRRARVWEEERHRYLPAWSVRRIYRQLIPSIKAASARGARR
jgi:DMSO/TMAO reductase YedYZ molybdopterin-dependent catalytic subunit